MLKQPIYYEFNLDARTSPSKLIAISHVDDKYSEVLEVAVKQNDRFVYMGGATVVARMVLHREKDYLLSDSVPCTVNANGNILIPFDNAVVKTSQGVVKIEVNITRDTDELTLQFPLWVSVTGSILDNAEVTPESEGTIPDLLKDAADALEDATEALEQLGSYSNLEDKPQINGVTLSGDQTPAELGLQKTLTAGDHITIDPVDGTISGFEVAGWKIEAIDNCIEDGVLYSTQINNQAAYVLAKNITTDITQYAFCRDGRVMWRTRQAETQWQPAGEWSEWEEIGGGSQIVSGVVNQNGTISFYDADGNLLFTTTGTSVIGPQGPAGSNYVLTDADRQAIAQIAMDDAAAEAAVTRAAINSISLDKSGQSITLSTGSIIDEQSLITDLSIPYGTKIYVKLGFSASSNPVVPGKAVQIRANGKFVASLNRGAVNNWTEVTLSGQLTSGEIITRLGVYLANDVLSTQTDFILSVRSSIIKSINDNADNISKANAVLQPLGETVNGHLLDYEILPTSNAPTFSGNTSQNDPLIVTLPYFYIRNKSAFGTAYTTITPSNSPFSVGHNEGLFYNLETKNLEVLSVANTPLDTKYILLLWKQITAVKGLWAYIYYDSVLKQDVEGRLSDSSGAVKTANLDDGAVTTAKLADGAVTSAKIGSGEVKTANLDDGAVTSAKLASSAVTSENLASGAVTLSKLDSGVIDKNLGTQGAAAEAAVTGAAINSISLNRSSQSIALSTGSIIDEQSLITGLSIPYGTKIYVKLGFSASSNPVVTGKAVQIRANGKFIASLNRGAVNNWTEVTLSGQLTSGEIITRLGVYLANDVLSTQTDFILSVRSSIMQDVEGRLPDSPGVVKTANLDDGAVTNDKLSEDLSAQIQQISSCKHYTKKIISRQGQGYGYPDNSLEGITAALKDGYRNIRLSVASTSDNVIYCTHSYELSHNTSYQTPVITQNGQPYTQNVVINDVTSEFIDSILYKGYAIPTLDEALKVISLYDADVTLEVKDDFSATAIQNIIDAIKFYSINITLSGLPRLVEPFANAYGGLNLGLIFNYSVNDAATYKARFEGKYKTVRFDCFFTDTITTANIINNIHPDVKLKLGGSFITAAQAREYMVYLDGTEYQGKVSDIY